MSRIDLVDMTGQRFGARVVVSYAGDKRWLTKCDCGTEVVSAGADLRRGRGLTCRHPAGLSLRFWKHVEKTPMCWLWSGCDDEGYGRFKANGTTMLAHVFAYIEAHGDVPSGMELDHLCRVRRCVRPDHLEPVTHRVNVLRGNMRSVVAARGYEV